MRIVTERKTLNNIGKTISELYRDSFQCLALFASDPVIWFHLTLSPLDRVTGSVVIITAHPTDLVNP